jgi:hypothetical protein
MSWAPLLQSRISTLVTKWIMVGERRGHRCCNRNEGSEHELGAIAVDLQSRINTLVTILSFCRTW